MSLLDKEEGFGELHRAGTDVPGRLGAKGVVGGFKVAQLPLCAVLVFLFQTFQELAAEPLEHVAFVGGEHQQVEVAVAENGVEGKPGVMGVTLEDGVGGVVDGVVDSGRELVEAAVPAAKGSGDVHRNAKRDKEGDALVDKIQHTEIILSLKTIALCLFGCCFFLAWIAVFALPGVGDPIASRLTDLRDELRRRR